MKKKQILFLRNDMEWGEISEMKHLHQQQPRERVYANVCIETIYLFFLRHFLHFSANYLKCSFCLFVCLSCFYFQWASGKQTRICEVQQCFIFIHRLLNYFLLYEIHVCLYLFEECIYLSSISRPTALLYVICECCDLMLAHLFDCL